MGLQPQRGERVVVAFHYAHPRLDAWLDALSLQATLLLLPQGPAQALVRAALGATLRRGALRAVLLPWLTQADFDRLLWSGDFNIVRGEDSLVRALWAGVPFVWQLYPQADGAHRRKLQAFLERWQTDSPLAPPAGAYALFEWWNSDGDTAAPPLPLAPAWSNALRGWREHLAGQSDLVARLLGFVNGKR
jgi:uncharacterized repeat protein (TIGR03837 family)